MRAGHGFSIWVAYPKTVNTPAEAPQLLFGGRAHVLVLGVEMWLYALVRVWLENTEDGLLAAGLPDKFL